MILCKLFGHKLSESVFLILGKKEDETTYFYDCLRCGYSEKLIVVETN